MVDSIVGGLFSVVICAGVAYFFLVTRGSLIAQALVGHPQDRFHVYWVYSSTKLTRFSDKKPCVAAVLLFQYDRLVDRIIDEITGTALKGKTVLMTSCAFGDVMPRVVRASVERGARRIQITDLIRNQLAHAGRKLGEFSGKFELAEADATCMPQEDGFADINLIFFLFHELPDPSKESALREAARLVAPGGKLIIAEFHRPKSRVFRLLGRIYFTVFEPFALSMWDKYDPVAFFDDLDGWTVDHSTYLLGNFQVVVATKQMLGRSDAA